MPVLQPDATMLKISYNYNNVVADCSAYSTDLQVKYESSVVNDYTLKVIIPQLGNAGAQVSIYIKYNDTFYSVTVWHNSTALIEIELINTPTVDISYIFKVRNNNNITFIQDYRFPSIDETPTPDSINGISSGAVERAIPKNYAGSASIGGPAKMTAGIPYAEVDSTSTATVYTATVPEITEYKDGICVLLRNGVVTSASGFTININDLGAKPSYSNMALGNDINPTNPTRDTTIFNINYAMLFVYNTTVVSTGCWICYRGYDANTNTIGYQIRTNSSTLKAQAQFYRYRLLFTSADGTNWVPANTSSSTNATALRTVNQTPIDPFGAIVYYSSTTAIEANANVTATAIWQQYALTLGYSFNRTGAALTLTSVKSVYLKCLPKADGSAIMDSTEPYTQSLPSSYDGYIYILLGRAYSATAIELLLTHPVYYHNGAGIRPWTGKFECVGVDYTLLPSSFAGSSTIYNGELYYCTFSAHGWYKLTGTQMNSGGSN